MAKHEQSLPEQLKLPAKSPGEHILNIMKAGISTAPFCGGIASLMSDYIPSGKIQRLEQFAEKLAEDLNNLQDRVDESLILTDEFAFLFEKCFKGVAENYQKERLEAFRNILVNSAIGIELSEDEKDYFLNLVTSLSVLHLRILHFMAKPTQYLALHDIPQAYITGGFSDFFPHAIPGVDIEVIKSAFENLHQYGLTNTGRSMFGTMTSGQGLDLLGNRVTGLGIKFMDFCLPPV